jgi:mutual gliding-motility protein MglA
MVVVSYSGKEINAKIVYYGPGLGGKTTNLERIFDSVPAANKGKMISMKTKADRTLFFDFLPLELGEIGGYRTRFMLYTVPGQVYYNATRKLVLKGVDAVVFVADSERGKMRDNQTSVENLRENLESYGIAYDEIPIVFQYNKRDLADKYSREELDEALGRGDRPVVEAVAARGEGVFETLRVVSELLLARLKVKLGALPQEGASAPAADPGRGGALKRPSPAPAAAPKPGGAISAGQLGNLAALGGAPAGAERPAGRAPIPVKSRAQTTGGPLETGLKSAAIPGMEAREPAAFKSPAAKPAASAPEERPPLEIVHPRSADRAAESFERAPVPPPPFAGQSEVSPAASDASRIVIPVELEASDLENGETVEIVIQLAVAKSQRRRVSG